MRLIIPIEFYRKGGVETVILSLTRELAQCVDKVVLVLPRTKISHFKKLLPNSERIVYESFSWNKRSIESQALSVLNKLLLVSKKLKIKPLERRLSKTARKLNSQYRINYLARQYQATHCLYLLTNRLVPPALNIPLAMLAHDVFWRFAPLTYSEAYMRRYDKNLLTWINQSDLVFTNSEKTRDDILSIFPNVDADKIKPIPLAGFISDRVEQLLNQPSLEMEQQACSIFYFPSSFGVYKDHLTLLEAGLKLASKGANFKIVLVGKETDGFLSGNVELSQQSKTAEYVDYLKHCHQLYKDNKTVISTYFKGLGYCSYTEVENWYNLCSCVVVPSKYEGFGLAVSEAIVRGVPAIVSNLDVFREQVVLYNCFDRVEFFPVGDANALADCMEKFMLNPKPKMSSDEIQSRFSHWTWQDVAKQYVKHLEELTKN